MVVDVIIFCGGKCGGTTLSNIFDKNGYKVLHLHKFNCKGLFSVKANIKNIFRDIEESSQNKKLYFIDSYRLPIERKISSFFQNISIHLPNYKKIPVRRLIKIFNNKYLMNLEEYHSINEALKKYDISLFEKFNFEKRYNIIEKDNKVFIKLLFRDIDKWNITLGNIFGKKINMFSKNLSKNKKYNNLYKKFKRLYRVPKSYLHFMYKNDKEFRIYNTKKEQVNYIKYWLKRSY